MHPRVSTSRATFRAWAFEWFGHTPLVPADGDVEAVGDALATAEAFAPRNAP